MKQLIPVLLLVSTVALGKSAPTFRGELVTGEKVSLSQYLKKDRALFLSFWASWCGPCIEELRSVGEKLKTDKTIPLDVLTVNVDTSETSSDIKPAIKLHRIEFPIVLDPKHEIFSKYQTAKTLPFSVLIGPKGTIEATFSGYNEAMFDKVREILALKFTNANAP